jgi:hypothetical protein
LLCNAAGHLLAQPAAERLPTVLSVGLILAQSLSSGDCKQPSSSFSMCIKSVERVFVSLCKSHRTLLASAVGTDNPEGW